MKESNKRSNGSAQEVFIAMKDLNLFPVQFRPNLSKQVKSKAGEIGRKFEHKTLTLAKFTAVKR